MPRSRSDQFFTRKILFLLLIGSLTAFLGASIAGKVELSLGTSQAEFIVLVFLSFLFFLLTGITWLYTAVIIKEREED